MYSHLAIDSNWNKLETEGPSQPTPQPEFHPSGGGLQLTNAAGLLHQRWSNKGVTNVILNEDISVSISMNNARHFVGL